MWLLEELQDCGTSLGSHGFPPSQAFRELEEALDGCKDLNDVPVGSVVAAIRGAKSCAWPPQLLQKALSLLSKGVEGASLILTRTRSQPDTAVIGNGNSVYP